MNRRYKIFKWLKTKAEQGKKDAFELLERVNDKLGVLL